MSDNDDGGRRLAPNWDDFIARAGAQKHVRTADLQAGDVLTVVTTDHRYTFTMLDAATHRFKIASDHPDFPGPYTGFLQGSVVHPASATMFLGRVQLGFRVVWSTPDLLAKYLPPIFVLSATQEVLVNGFKVLPAGSDDTVQ